MKAHVTSIGEGFAFNQWYLFNSDDRVFAHFCRDAGCSSCAEEARRQWRVNSRG